MTKTNRTEGAAFRCVECARECSGLGYCDHCRETLCWLCARIVLRNDGAESVLCSAHVDKANDVPAPRYGWNKRVRVAG